MLAALSFAPGKGEDHEGAKGEVELTGLHADQAECHQPKGILRAGESDIRAGKREQTLTLLTFCETQTSIKAPLHVDLRLQGAAPGPGRAYRRAKAI